MRLYFEKRVLAGFFCALVFIIGLDIYSYFNEQQVTKTNELVAHTNKMLFHSEKLLTQVTDVKASQRWYIITGDSAFFEPYITTSPAIDTHFRELVEIRRVWINLISNALKYTQKTLDPKIGIRPYVERGDTVYDISNNGVGFDMKYIEKLFGVFQRLHQQQDFGGPALAWQLYIRSFQDMVEKSGRKEA